MTRTASTRDGYGSGHPHAPVPAAPPIVHPAEVPELIPVDTTGHACQALSRGIPGSGP